MLGHIAHELEQNLQVCRAGRTMAHLSGSLLQVIPGISVVQLDGFDPA